MSHHNINWKDNSESNKQLHLGTVHVLGDQTKIKYCDIKIQDLGACQNE